MEMMEQIEYPLLIDGGLSNQLERLGYDLNHRLWSAKLLYEHPEAIVAAHLAYLEAGARCITTASYQASVPGFIPSGFTKSEAEILLKRSIELANIAIDKFQLNKSSNHRSLIAASIGPYGAFLADGSEYIGKYTISDSELKSFHLERLRLLDELNFNFYACETIPSFREARILSELLRKMKKPSWISFSCKNENQINGGTPISEVVQLFDNHPKVFAVGINCTAPDNISGLIKKVKPLIGDKKLIVYPNSGELYDPKKKMWNSSINELVWDKAVCEWLDLGVDIIGGCCRIGPVQIARIADILNNNTDA